MQKRLFASVAILGMSMLVVGCSSSQSKNHQTESSSAKTTQKSQSSSKKKSRTAQSSSASQTVSSSSESSSATAAESQAPKQHSDIDASGHKKMNFPAQMQGTWYGWDKYENEVKSVKFVGNQWITSGEYGGKTEAYDGSVRTKEDREALQDPRKAENAEMKSWAALSTFTRNEAPLTQNGQPIEIVNLLGWYQTAGAGTYYYVTTAEINGQKTQVLTQASGAGIWVDLHYYRSESLALSQKDASLPTDVQQ
ncbi:hypothetical protein LPAF129_19220 [Ligilactobacillus pabuli]|uniref:Lipoprotein n=1 Tax=Ligilactobacillus pabuli TaxID=2886039 RepID=A0ABQ5JJE2_9LACO|nr:hypothetical protein [Ligilactobacillus pabuli]GKS82236.1 hypothetical protein LPAF129_19220 [Ligilactobacillus pabuli]